MVCLSVVADKDLQSIAVTNKFGGAYRFWGKCAGRFFRPAPALGYALVASACFALTPAHDALRFVLRSLVRTTATMV